MWSKKIIISNYNQLKLKYNSFLPEILNELNLLLESDKKRGISSKIVFVDHKKMKSIYGVSPVLDYKNEEQNKIAIDAIYNGEGKPEYLMILGAIDVVPHQSLKNPVNDLDTAVSSDLPYACHKKYSKNIYDFIGPSRVIGRLPDITDSKDPGYLIKLIRYIINFKERNKSYYHNYVGACSSVFTDTTTNTIENIFNNHDSLICSPPDDFNNLENKIYNSPAQFYNCHGNSKIPFWGEKGNKGEIIYLLKSSMLNKQLPHSAIIVSEACFGAELYDPKDSIIPDTKDILPICNNLLQHGAIGFYGSTDTLYGKIDDGEQKQGDLITKFFLNNIINRNCSLGRAGLEAQHQFIAACENGLTPYDLKTIAQCILLGDPSLHPVVNSSETKMNKEIVTERVARRNQYSLSGESLYGSSSFYQPVLLEDIPLSIDEKIQEYIKKYGLIKQTIFAYSKSERKPEDKTGIEKIDSGTVLYVVQGELTTQNDAFKEAALTILTKSDEVIEVKLLIKK